MDKEFDKVVEHVPLVKMNLCAAREDVGEIERDICTQNEWCQAIVSMQPYPVLPKPFVIRSIVAGLRAVLACLSLLRPQLCPRMQSRIPVTGRIITRRTSTRAEVFTKRTPRSIYRGSKR